MSKSWYSEIGHVCLLLSYSGQRALKMFLLHQSETSAVSWSNAVGTGLDPGEKLLLRTAS